MREGELRAQRRGLTAIDGAITLIAVLLIVGVLVVFASSSPLAPFLYPLF